ncbi:MAG: tetratricopeptide repeat protein, partial [Fibrobacter sp.]|nr:tetratricopeptide repeat protein [Fibrobacter sp.]
MIKIMRLNWFFLIIVAISLAWADTDSTVVSAPEQPKTPKNVVFLMGRPVDASVASADKWLSALIEAIFEFKFAPVKGFTMIEHEDIRKYVPDHSDLFKTPSNAAYFDAAAKLKADYVGIQKFEVAGKDVFYYLEITSVKDHQMAGTVELDFKAAELGGGLDRIIEMILKELNVTPQKELGRFLRMPSIGNKIRNVKRLGDVIISERFAKGMDPQGIAQEYRAVCDADPSLLVGFYRAGKFFEAIGKPNEASQAFNLLFMSLPEYLPIYIPLARNFRNAGQYESAVRIAMLGEQRGIKSTELVSEKAMAFEKLGKPEEAEKAYKTILENDPDDQFALLYYARKNNNEGKAKDALEYSQKLLKLGWQAGLANMERGRSLVLLSQKTDAIAAFNKAIEIMPDNHEPYVYLGDLYCDMKRYSDAFNLYNKILKKSDNIDVYIKAANACEKMGDSKKAYQILKPMESRYSNHGDLQRELGLLTLTNGDTLRAKSLLEASIRSGTENDRVLMALGWIYNAAADYEKATKMFTLAMSKTPNKSKAKLGLAMVFIRQGKSSTALSLLGEVSADDLNEPGMNRLLGDSFFANNEKKKALGYYKKERKYAQTDTVLQGTIATLAYETGTPQEARVELEKLVKMGAGGANALYQLGVLSLRLKDTNGAENYFSKAETRGKADADTYYLIGKECASLGMNPRAISSLENCLKLNPSKDSAWVALTKLLEKTGKDSAAAEAHLKLYLVDKVKYGANLAIAGKLFEKSGVKDKARNAYNMFVQSRLNDPDVYVRLAMMESENKNYKRVVELLKDLPPSSINVKEALILAEAYCNTNQFVPALTHLDYVLKVSPANLRATELSAVANDKANNADKAIAMYKKYLLAKKEPHQEYGFRIAFLYEQKKDINNAIIQYVKNTKDFPDDYRNFDRLARLYAETGKWKLAVPVLEKALTFKEVSPQLNELLAKAQISTGDKSQAAESYRSYLQRSPGDSTAWVELGELYFNQKKYVESAQAFEKAMTLMKRDASLYKKVGICYVNAGEYAKACEALKNAHTMDNTDIETVKLLAKCYRETKVFSYLTNLLVEWAKLEPKNFEIRKELGELFLAQSKTTAAAEILEEAVLLKNCADGLHVTLTEIYEKLSMEDKKVYHLQAALNCSPRDPELTYKIASYFYNRKDYVKAKQYLNKTVTLSPKHADGNYLLGACLLQEKNPKQATVYF